MEKLEPDGIETRVRKKSQIGVLRHEIRQKIFVLLNESKETYEGLKWVHFSYSAAI